jgi:threonine/homoserine/homoserine lactone efflux protein
MVLLLAGPLLWLLVLVGLAVVAKTTDFILYGLVIAGVSFILGGAIHLAARAHRLREEQNPALRR